MCIIIICNDVAHTQVVFWDLRHDWLEMTYRHHVTSARIDPIITSLNMVRPLLQRFWGDNKTTITSLNMVRLSSKVLWGNKATTHLPGTLGF